MSSTVMIALVTVALGRTAARAAPSMPYLQLGGPGGFQSPPGLVVRWFTPEPWPGRIELRLPGEPETWLAAGESPAGRRHAVVLDGAPPGMPGDGTYRVIVAPPGAPAETTATFAFRTLPVERTEPFTFIVYGDNRSQPKSHRAVVERILAGPRPRLIVHTGDVVEAGEDSLRWHEEFLDPGGRLYAAVPIVVTPGNHELDRTLRPRALGRHWREMLTLPGNGTAQGGGRWYALRAGGCLVICLDSTAPEAPGQTQWLAATLAAADPRDFVIVAMHHPVWAWGGHGGDAKVRAAWGRLLDSPRVNVVFCGHNHFYQRTYPLRAGGAVTRRPGRYRAGQGTVHCTAGGGGAPLYSPESEARVAVNSQIYHYVQVDYAPEALTCTAIDKDGRVIDRFTIVR